MVPTVPRIRPEHHCMLADIASEQLDRRHVSNWVIGISVANAETDCRYRHRYEGERERDVEEPSIVALRGGLSVAALLRGGQRTGLLRRAVDGLSSIRKGEARRPHGPQAGKPAPPRSRVPPSARPRPARPLWSRSRAPTEVGAAPDREPPTR